MKAAAEPPICDLVWEVADETLLGNLAFEARASAETATQGIVTDGIKATTFSLDRLTPDDISGRRFGLAAFSPSKCS